MNSYVKKTGPYIPLIVICIAGLVAAIRINTVQAELCQKVKNLTIDKLDKELYDREQKLYKENISLWLKQIDKQLSRIEAKVDAISRKTQNDAIDGRN